MTAWKAFERKVGSLIGGKRFWANSGQDIDVESDELVVQCKNVKVLAFPALERLACKALEDGRKRGKVGIVAVKRRGGRGVETPTLLVVHEEALTAASGEAPEAIESPAEPGGEPALAEPQGAVGGSGA